MLPLLLQLADLTFEPAPTPDQQEVIEARVDALQRLTVPVSVNGAPPVRFLVDTGAERTVLGNVAASAITAPRATATLIHMAGRSPVELVRVDELALGASRYRNLEAPVLPRRVMGVDGVLGTDALQDQRVLFDFAGGQVTLIQPGERPPSGNEIVIRGRRKSGRLILTRARIDGVSVDVVVDTGAHRTVANPALADRLGRRHTGEVVDLASITGDIIAIRLLSVKRLAIGQVAMDDFTIGVVASPAFAALDLADRPAILLGMDALSQFSRVLIDFPRRSVAFALDGERGRDRFSSAD